jgi:hypothetical protein
MYSRAREGHLLCAGGHDVDVGGAIEGLRGVIK